ncbi:MAG: hypothetical protein M1457_09745, partial [bacterium]|nr:hypothetical protein [bacterium]
MTQAFAVQAGCRNQGLRSPLDVMLVSTAWVDPEAATESDLNDHPWALPALTAADDNNLDVRLVDCFRIGARLRETAAESTAIDDAEAAGATASSAIVTPPPAGIGIIPARA